MQNAKPNNSFKDAQLWELPTVDDAEQALDTRTNAFNKPMSRWQYEPPEEEEASLRPLTAEQIEEIRQAAHQEGFAAGQQEGLEKGQQEGFQQGFEQGLEEGKQQGALQALEEAQPQIQQQVTELAELIKHLKAPLASVNTDLKHELYLLAMELASKIVHQHIEMNEPVVLEAIQAALSSLPINDQKVDIYIHPEQLVFVQSHLNDLTIDDKALVSVHADAEIEKGGCKVMTKNNAVDLSIKRRTEHVFEQILSPLGLSDDPRAN